MRIYAVTQHDHAALLENERVLEQRGVAGQVSENAYVREPGGRSLESGALYGPDARLKGEESAMDAATVNKLEQRDREVRQREEAKGEAIGGENYIYQIGPDGKRYAIGAAAHAVRPEDQSGGSSSVTRAPDGSELSAEDEDLVRRLEARDDKVRAHEAAHVMAAGGQAGMPVYTFQTGPDGRRYAVGGSVSIAILATGDEAGDARRARRAYRAAMAVGEPSAQDMETASLALAKARRGGMDVS